MSHIGRKAVAAKVCRASRRAAARSLLPAGLRCSGHRGEAVRQEGCEVLMSHVTVVVGIDRRAPVVGILRQVRLLHGAAFVT